MTTKRICRRTVSLSMPKCSTPSVLKQKLSSSRDSRLSSSDSWLSELWRLQKPAYTPTSFLIITQPCSTYLLVPLDSFLFISPFLHLLFPSFPDLSFCSWNFSDLKTSEFRKLPDSRFRSTTVTLMESIDSKPCYFKIVYIPKEGTHLPTYFLRTLASHFFPNTSFNETS